MNQRPRPLGHLVDALQREAQTPCTGKGGWPTRIRMQQRLMLEAALTLAKWGRPAPARRRRQPVDLFAPREAAE